MPILHPYIVTRADYFGNDYTSTVYLTTEQARDLIVDGRLLPASVGRSRRLDQLWKDFTSLGKQPGSGYISQEWVERERVKQEEEK
jgi:hypothetical protein